MSRTPSGRWVENRHGTRSGASAFRELWAYRELAGYLALRDVKARYKQAAFGLGWAVLQPLATVGILALVFGKLAGVATDPVPYVVFAVASAVVWDYCAAGVTNTTDSLVENAPLLTKVYFPRLLAPASALLAPLIALAVGMAVLVAVMAADHELPPVQALLVPGVLVWMIAAAFAPGLLLATANVRYRDVGALQAPLMQLWLLASPVGYPATLVPDGWQAVYGLNPLAGPLEAFRWVVLDVPPAGAVLASSAFSAGLLLVAALVYFAFSEGRLADVI